MSQKVCSLLASLAHCVPASLLQMQITFYAFFRTVHAETKGDSSSNALLDLAMQQLFALAKANGTSYTDLDMLCQAKPDLKYDATMNATGACC